MQEKDIQIQKYLDKSMSKEERINFEEELNKNKTLQQDFKLLRDIEQELGNNELIDFKKKLAGVMEQSVSPTSIEVPSRKVLPISSKLLSVAASLLVIGFTAWWLYSSSAEKSISYAVLADDYFIHYPAEEIARGTEERNPIYNHYKAKNYRLAATELDKYAQENSDYDALLIAAIAYLADNKPNKTIQLLQKIPDTPYFKNKKNYYLALSHLKQGHKTTALEVLQTINETDKFLYTKAQDLFSKLQ